MPGSAIAETVPDLDHLVHRLNQLAAVMFGVDGLAAAACARPQNGGSIQRATLEGLCENRAGIGARRSDSLGIRAPEGEGQTRGYRCIVRRVTLPRSIRRI